MKYLHTMLRVVDLDKSLKFYCEALGFTLISREDYPEDKFTLAFVSPPGGAAKKEDGPMIELTWNWDTKSYNRGDAYGHVAFQVDSIADVQKRLRQHGHDLSWGPGETPSGERKMAFIDDPDGYEIELLEG